MGILGEKLDTILYQVQLVKPKTYIEIGCYRCETMREVRELDIVNHIVGFDLFEPAPPEEEAPLDGPPITFEEAQKEFEVYKGDTNETLKQLKGKDLEGPILIFIDGGRSMKTTLNDIKQCREYLPEATLLIDDISMHGVRMAMEASGLEWIVVGTEVAKFNPKMLE